MIFRFPENPILRPADVKPSRPDMEVACLLNPGAFVHNGRIGLLLRVAERPVQEDGFISTPVLDPEAPDGMRIVKSSTAERGQASDARLFVHEGQCYLTTLSHLRLAWSDDGVRFEVEPEPVLIGNGKLESFGIEDARVCCIDGVYNITYTAVSDAGYGVGLIRTKDWKTFDREGMIFPPPNKDCALFPEKINGHYYALHRPTHNDIGGPWIWISRSPDLLHWGAHQWIARPRPGWEAMKIGAGAEPIRTPRGWLEIYHAVDAKGEYSLGLLLLDLNDPTKVLARSTSPIMRPAEDYETAGFMQNVVFTNGHVVDGDTVTMYYGAADSVICGARLSIAQMLESLNALDSGE
ncbi:glycoside hydrolase family 130 protein [Ereboglobus luteus]|nr:glycoside hydrolase family 130 protein [Ereboglobus luteus]